MFSFKKCLSNNGSVTELGVNARDKIKINLLYEGNGDESHYNGLFYSKITPKKDVN